MLPSMHQILARQQLSPNVTRLDVHAPRLAQIRQPGQFVIVRLGDHSERIPLTIADADAPAGAIALVIQAVGKGHPTEIISRGRALCIGGGVGTAVVHPIAQGLHQNGVHVTTIIGGRSKEWVIFENELRRLGDVVVCTDDGSHGQKGFVTDAAQTLLAAGSVDIVYAVGPVPMMRAVVNLTKPLGVRTVVSLNPVMIDGTGMCGGCRVTLGTEIKFACVDGPEFDGHLVNFEELQDRLGIYREFEQHSHNACPPGTCRVDPKKVAV
jgi:ferredoxin--NADP+ reductase